MKLREHYLSESLLSARNLDSAIFDERMPQSLLRSHSLVWVQIHHFFQQVDQVANLAGISLLPRQVPPKILFYCWIWH